MDDAFYVIDGKRFDRVTQILSTIRNPDLEEWRGRVGNKEANRIAKEATGVGSAVHEEIERRLQGWPPSESKGPKGKEIEYANCLEAFEEWRASRKPEPVFVEKRVWSPFYGYAGTIDLIEEEILTDWKTSGRLSDTYWLQLNAYAVAAHESIGFKVRWLRVVRLDKNLGTFEEAIQPVNDQLFQAFVGLHKFYKVWQAFKWEQEGVDEYAGIATTAGSKKADKQVDRPEVSDDRAGQGGKVGFLEPW